MGSRVKKASKVEDIEKFFQSTVEGIENFYNEFKSWYDDPVRVSQLPPPSNGSSEDLSPLGYHYEHPKVPLVRVRDPPRSQTTPPPRSRSQSPMLQLTPHTTSWSSEIPTDPYERPRSNTRDASMGSSLRPSFRSAYSSTEGLSRQGSSDRFLGQESHSESGIPRQAVRAATVVLERE